MPSMSVQPNRNKFMRLALAPYQGRRHKGICETVFMNNAKAFKEVF